MRIIKSKEGLIIHNIEYVHLQGRYCNVETIVRPTEVTVDVGINSLEIKGKFRVDDYLDMDEIKSMILEKMKGSIKLLEAMK